jgi:hypothetical protein
MGLAHGLNRSILFLLAMIGAVGLCFGLLVLRAYRDARRRSVQGESFAPEGKVRWSAPAENAE